ncbi:MAG: PilZ domain-containing protein [Isosphaera sp.]|nr:PilZ domain-containing protein [Isosphaera sp.]
MTPAPANRRAAPRFQPAFGTVYTFRRGDAYAVGLVWNISVSGVSMLLADPPEPGEEVSGELTAGAADAGLPVAVRVVHVRRVPTGDYFLGAKFARPLSPEELRPFLAPGADPFTPPG